MTVIEKPAEMTRAAKKEKQARGNSIGFVPTLGYLHEGHEALIRRAKKENDVVVVSTFVNPPQFRAKAYREYPRDMERDLAICKKLKVNYVFAPAAADMYPQGFETVVEAADLPGRLEGARLRWHYRAVTTVVAKLFNIAAPDRAYFGKKDAHQLAIIKRMTADLNFPVRIVAVPTVRARDGLALSSRNSLLSAEERRAALAIPRALKEIERRIREGGTDRGKLAEDLAAMIEQEPLLKTDFAAVVDADTLREDVYGARSLIYAAVYAGGRRLTDNRLVINPSYEGRRSSRRA